MVGTRSRRKNRILAADRPLTHQIEQLTYALWYKHRVAPTRTPVWNDGDSFSVRSDNIWPFPTHLSINQHFRITSPCNHAYCRSRYPCHGHWCLRLRCVFERSFWDLTGFGSRELWDITERTEGYVMLPSSKQEKIIFFS